VRSKQTQRRFLGAALVLSSLSCVGPLQAAAASSVTLFGVVDQGLVYEHKNGQSSLKQKSSNQAGSRWGLRGSEDLGDGYKATFLLESGFNLTDGTQGQGRLFGRGTHIGLSGDFGEIKMGRMSVFGSDWGGVGSPFGGGWGQSGNGTVLGNGKGDFGEGGRVNNAFFYTSPRMDGWQGGVGYSLEATNGDAFATSAHDRVLTTGLRYDNGPVALALTYDRSIPNLQEPKEKKEQKDEEKKKFIRKKASSNIQIAAAYDFEMFKVHASYGNLRKSNSDEYGKYKSVHAVIAGVTVPTGRTGKLMAVYQHSSAKIEGWALGYQYDLSKRTNLYAFLNRVDTAGSHKLQSALGVRHTF